MAETRDTPVTVDLEGGPADLPAEARRVRTEATPLTIKVEHLGGYEHFERAADGRYRWTVRTRIAE